MSNTVLMVCLCTQQHHWHNINKSCDRENVQEGKMAAVLRVHVSAARIYRCLAGSRCSQIEGWVVEPCCIHCVNKNHQISVRRSPSGIRHEQKQHSCTRGNSKTLETKGCAKHHTAG
jgi:hypothetical protein